MKKILKSKIFWTGVVLVIIIGGVVASQIFFNSGKKIDYVTADVIRGTIIQTVTATGKVKAATDIQLNFKNPGLLAVLNVKAGDLVTAGQLLAQLNAVDLAISVRKAQAVIAQSQAALNKVRAGATKQDIAVSQAAVDQAKSSLASAQDDLKNSQNTYQQNLVNARQSMLTDINSALTQANVSLQHIYDTINYKGDPNNISTANVSLYQRVVSENTAAVSAVDDAELSYNIAKLSLADDQIDSAVDKTIAALSQLSTTLDDLASVLNYAIVTNRLSQTELDGLKADINTEQVATGSSLSTVHSGSQDLADARLNYQTKTDAAANAVNAAERSLNTAQANLDLKRASARPEDIASAQAALQNSQADLALAQEKYNETIIRSPINGVVTDTYYSVGEQTNIANPVITMLANEQYEIEVNIPESDIVKVNVGDSVSITLDAFTDQDIFDGVATTINPAQTEIQDVIYYKLTVTFNSSQPDAVKALVEKIKPGMTANVTVNTAHADNVLMIPLRAIKETDSKKTVDVLENNQPRTVDIITGLRGDEAMVEVTSGLTEGQKVVTYIRGQ